MMIFRKQHGLIATLSLMLVVLVGIASAQSATPVDPDDSPESRACVFSITASQPTQVEQGSGRILTVRGSNFPANSVILIGGSALTTTIVSTSILTATIPNSIPANAQRYNVSVVDPTNCRVKSPDKLLIVAPPVPPATVVVIDTPEPPTPVPGSPSLLARNFSANPPNVVPGGTVTLTFEVYNQGNRTAEGVSASLEAGGTFLPAGGQASNILPNIPPGGVASVTLTAVSAASAEPGPTTVPVTIDYRDFSGESYSDKAALSVTIERVTQTTQIILSEYLYNPEPIVPGEEVTVTITVKNTGTTPAERALLRVSGEGVLLAGRQGDSFPLADLMPGASATQTLSLIAKQDAKAGPQPQPFSIIYTREGEAQTIEGAMTLEVARVVEEAPLLLLDEYSTDKDPLRPGEQFKLSVTLKNVGAVTAAGMLVTFGTVESTGGGTTDPDDSDGGSGGSGGGSSTSTTPSTTFAPLGTGGTLFIGDVGADKPINFEQEFIVNGTTASGIYSLPITLRYQKPDGSAAQDSLRASVVVIKPPDLRVTLQSPPPESVNVGESVSLSYDLVNGGTTVLSLTNSTVEVENGEVLEGLDTFVGKIAGGDQGVYSATVMPLEEGTMDITVKIRYLDDLNNVREIINTYKVEALEPPPPPEFEPTPDLLPMPTPEPEPQDDWLGRLLLGLLGLGS